MRHKKTNERHNINRSNGNNNNISTATNERITTITESPQSFSIANSIFTTIFTNVDTRLIYSLTFLALLRTVVGQAAPHYTGTSDSTSVITNMLSSTSSPVNEENLLLGIPAVYTGALLGLGATLVTCLTCYGLYRLCRNEPTYDQQIEMLALTSSGRSPSPSGLSPTIVSRSLSQNG